MVRKASTTTHQALFDDYGLWNRSVGPEYEEGTIFGSMPDGVVLSDYHAFILLRNRSLSKKGRATNFPGDYNSHGEITLGRIHRRRAAKFLGGDGLYYYCVDKKFDYVFMGDEDEHRNVITGKPCARQENVADDDKEVAGLVEDSSDEDESHIRINFFTPSLQRL